MTEYREIGTFPDEPELGYPKFTIATLNSRKEREI
jgi:hypothetical protein